MAFVSQNRFLDKLRLNGILIKRATVSKVNDEEDVDVCHLMIGPGFGRKQFKSRRVLSRLLEFS